jgi:antitoxin (DNA-binding transcriptional repressor) of toxin-antitoxin stability system
MSIHHSPGALANPGSVPAYRPGGLHAPSAPAGPGDRRRFAGDGLPLPPLGAARPVSASPATFFEVGPSVEAEPQIYTMRELGQHAAKVMGEIEQSGIPAFITKHGRFIAMITPLAAGRIESLVLAAMAQEIEAEADQ